MASLQDQVAALPERLIDGLSYDNIGNTANYVLDCDQATLFPASGNTFSSTTHQYRLQSLDGARYRAPLL